MAKFRLKYIDHSLEMASFEAYVREMGADNIGAYAAAVTVPLQAAIDGVTLLNNVDLAFTALNTQFAGTPPADKNAQKEISWTVHFRDDVTGRAYVRTIPGADMSLTLDNSDRMDLSAGAGLALKTAWDAHVKSQDGNDTTLEYVELKQ